MAQAFERIVIQVDVRQVDFSLVDRLRIDGVVVVVGGDFYFAAVRVLHRMVAAMVAKFEFISLAAECEADELMAEANAEYRLTAGQFADIFLRVGDRLGVARPIREEDAVGVERENFLG